MSKDVKDLSLKALPAQLVQLSQTLRRYSIILFVLFIAAVYGFISYKIFTLSNPPTDTSDVTTQVTTLTPRIDEQTVEQLESLKDNSVNVRALFDKARKNPFAD
jgi:hypothetical protein